MGSEKEPEKEEEERSDQINTGCRSEARPLSLFYIIHGTEEYLNKYERYFYFTHSPIHCHSRHSRSDVGQSVSHSLAINASALTSVSDDKF